MAQFERVREAIEGVLDADYVRRREQAGWRIVGVEWEREAAPSGAVMPGSEPESAARRHLDELVRSVPYGARVAEDCARLEENPNEMQFLLSMMELIIQDISISKVAEELNRKGFRTARVASGGRSASSICCRGSSNSLPGFSPPKNGSSGARNSPWFTSAVYLRAVLARFLPGALTWIPARPKIRASDGRKFQPTHRRGTAARTAPRTR